MQKRIADPQIEPDPSAGSSPAFIRARLALASSYVKNAFTSRFLFAIHIPLAIRFSHIKQKKNRIAAILSLAGGVETGSFLAALLIECNFVHAE